MELIWLVKVPIRSLINSPFYFSSTQGTASPKTLPNDWHSTLNAANYKFTSYPSRVMLQGILFISGAEFTQYKREWVLRFVLVSFSKREAGRCSVMMRDFLYFLTRSGSPGIFALRLTIAEYWNEASYSFSIWWATQSMKLKCYWGISYESMNWWRKEKDWSSKFVSQSTTILLPFLFT